MGMCSMSGIVSKEGGREEENVLGRVVRDDLGEMLDALAKESQSNSL